MKNNADDNVGEILLQVQKEVHQLREKVQAQRGEHSFTVEDLDSVLAKTEQELQNKTADFAYQLNSRVKTIPSGNFEDERRNPRHGWELGNGDAEIRLTYLPNERNISQHRLMKPWYQLEQRQTPKQWDFSKCDNILLPQRHASRPSPGQNFKHRVTVKAAVNPLNEKNRNVLHDSYGIQLPLISQKKQEKDFAKKIVIGTTINKLAALPPANRFDPSLTPPPITERDAQKGLLSLLQRGLIPSTAEITLEPAPVEMKAISKTESLPKPKKKIVPSVLEFGGNLIPVKGDVQSSDDSQSSKKSVASSRNARQEFLLTTSIGPTKIKKLFENNKPQSQDIVPPASPKTILKERTFSSTIPLPPPTTPSSPMPEMMFKLAIQDGKTRTDTNEFASFKHAYQNEWGRISTVLEYLENLLSDNSIPFAFVNGNSLINLVEVIDIERKPASEDLINVFVNAKEIMEKVNTTKQKYLGDRGLIFAAITIQKNWRRLYERRKFLEYRKLKWASSIFAMSWVMRLRTLKNKEKLRQTRADNLELFRNKKKAFKSSWKRIKHSRRVVVHIPSLGYHEDIRGTMYNFHVEQNNQISRICDVLDPNVDVIFVSPIPVTDEAKQYYLKLLSLKSAIDTGDLNKLADMSTRLTFIVPEVIGPFGNKNLCLSSMLKYSPDAQRRIQRLIKGRDAYIVPGLMHLDDLDIARELDIPIMGAEPKLAQVYSTKSGAKRIFQIANVDMPPGECDIYSSEQFHEMLAQLVVNNISVKRWLFKFDRSVSGNGIAYCDVINFLKCYNYVLKEKLRFGKEWRHRWAQEASFHQVFTEVPGILMRHARIVNPILYPTWEDFKTEFLNEGGIIEAYPAAECVTVLQADMLIEPDGQTRLLCIGDQIANGSVFKPWGISIPQSSIEAEQVNSVCKKVAGVCISRNIIGYLSLTLVTFINEETMEQVLWCVDMSLNYSDNLAMFGLFRLMTNCSFDIEKHLLTIPKVESTPKTDSKPERFTTIKKREFVPYRFGVMSTKLYHSNLSIIHYSVFFQMCRSHGIGYDIKEKQGTIFTLIDYTNRDHMGMMVVGDQLPSCLAAFARNLNIIHQEVSSPNMQGETNFKDAIEGIKEILGITTLNAMSDDEDSNEDNEDETEPK